MKKGKYQSPELEVINVDVQELYAGSPPSSEEIEVTGPTDKIEESKEEVFGFGIEF